MNLHLNITQDIGHGIMIIFLCFMLVLFAVVFDLYTGVRAAKKLKEKIQSHILRRTILKIIDYLTVVFFGVLIDVLGLCFPWYAIPYCCIVTTLGVILIEGKSVIENHTKIKSPAARVPETIGDIAEKIIKCDNIKDAMEIAEKLKN
ncbi:MAG: phage holin family protein [Bacteroidales bacterium]|nr:phage holin family protein [Bacteroidales bacterium]MBQ8761657.1 phage holin family protein [Bacteroidales bacterium]